MTIPTPSGSGALGRVVSTPRALAAWALLGYTALYLFFEFFDWLLPGGTFSGRSAGAGFHNLFVMAMPLVAVLLAAYVTPELAMARLIAMIALIEYVVALFFGVVTLLIGLGAVFDGADTLRRVFDGLRYLVLGVAELGLVVIASYVVFRAYTKLGGRLPTMRNPVPPAA
jgi:hypothetical protein